MPSRIEFWTCLLFISITTLAGRVQALERPGSELKETHPQTIQGAHVDLALTFTDSQGLTVRLGDFFVADRPVLLVPVYFRCPRLCGLLLDGVITLVEQIGLLPGSDFSLIALSFDSTETPQEALNKEQIYADHLRKTGIKPAGLHFLTGTQPNISTLMEQIGFRYSEDGGEYAHSAVLFLLTPEGKISQYFTGVSFPALDVRLAMIEASQGRIGSLFDHVLLFCFRFDPTKGKYTWAAVNLMRAGGVLTILFLALLMLRLFRSERIAGRSGTADCFKEV